MIFKISRNEVDRAQTIASRSTWTPKAALKAGAKLWMVAAAAAAGTGRTVAARSAPDDVLVPSGSQSLPTYGGPYAAAPVTAPGAAGLPSMPPPPPFHGTALPLEPPAAGNLSLAPQSLSPASPRPSPGIPPFEPPSGVSTTPISSSPGRSPTQALPPPPVVPAPPPPPDRSPTQVLAPPVVPAPPPPPGRSPTLDPGAAPLG